MASTPHPVNRVAFTHEEILAATSAETLSPSFGPVEGICTDSRTVEPGNLFVALRGERHDGHDHLEQALARGARAVVVERIVKVPEGIGAYRVDDTLRALGALARFHRRRFRVPVIGITGSVGKTSTKELLAAALRGLGKSVAFTRGNLNNRIGVPLTLFTLGSEHDAAVIEMGMNQPGEIAELTAMAEPTVGLVTAVAEVHTEGVGGIESIANEKGALLRGLASDAVAVWNADEASLVAQAEQSKACRRITYGRVDEADVRLVRWELDGHGATQARFRVPGREAPLDVRLSMLGETAALNAAGALAVVLDLEPAGLDAAAAALSAVPPAHARMVPHELSSGLLVIDDTYNASPRSTVAALETAALLASIRGGALVAVLGDMLELGRDAERLHETVGREAIRAGTRALIACGELMKHAGRTAINAASAEPRGKRAKVVLLRDATDAAACVQELAGPRDVVLVKGSRGMRMERVVDALREEA